MIPYGRQYIDEDDIQAVVNVLRGDYLTTGPCIASFEKNLAEYVGAKYAVAVSSGTTALHLAVKVLGLSMKAEGMTSVNTFLASANAMIYCGLRPLFADINLKSRNITVDSVAKYITPNTRLIIPVHFAGEPCDVRALQMNFGDDVCIVEDAAHALGSKYADGSRVGSCRYSHMTTFSFHPVKIVTTGEGGAITTNDPEIYARLVRLRNHGMEKDKILNACWGFTDGEKNIWYYEQQELGFNFRMPDINAALGISQLKKIDGFIKRRKEISAIYADKLGNSDFVSTPHYSKETALHLYTVLVDFKKLGKTRNECMKSLKRDGVLTQVHYIPLNLQPYYQQHYGYTDEGYPNAVEYYRCCLSLPLFPAMNNEDVNIVVDAIKKLGT